MGIEGPLVVGTFRRVLPQILACVAKSLILVDIGLALGFPSIVIPALTQEHNNESLHFSQEQSSWFGSLIFISQPVGSILSGWLTDWLGRKNAMILVNIPHLAAWLMIYYATTVPEMYAAAIILGLGIGIMETPVVTYIGEICQPSIRGILTATTGVAVTVGYTIVYSLGWMFYWRTVALICFAVPSITILVILFVPETPLWLLMRENVEAARRSLRWLRGWVPAATVESELRELQRYCAEAKQCKTCDEDSCNCEGTEKWTARWRRFTASGNLKPFFVVTMFLVFTQLSGFAAMRPFLVQILKTYRIPLDAGQAMSIIGLLKLAANLTIMATVKWAGKRRLSLLSSSGVAICTLTLGIYSYLYLPTGSRSTLALIDNDDGVVQPEYSGIIPLILFFALAFSTSLGIAPIPWMLLSEVLPIRTRAITSGVTVTINYLIVFLVTKTYLQLENHLSMFGVMWLYFVFGCCLVVFLYFFLPETENRTLEEIEQHFATKPLTTKFINKIDNKVVEEVVGEEKEKNNGRAKHPEDVELL